MGGDNSFPTIGITVNGIKMFIESQGGIQTFQGKCTTDICNQFLKPFTVHSQESFCETFRAAKPSLETSLAKLSIKGGPLDPAIHKEIAQATAFVSHAWSQEFLDVVAALEDYDQSQATKTYFWFDIFSNNQHKTADRDFNWWQTVFRDNIGSLKKTLLVLEWETPRPLGRAWCLWEMACTVNTKCEFRVLMSPKNQASFKEALETQFSSIALKTCNVDVEKAESWNPSDRDNIFAAVRATAGFHEVNKQVIGIMRDWMLKSGKAALERIPQHIRAASALQVALGSLYAEQAKYEEAERLLKEAYRAQKEQHGEEHIETFKAMKALASVYDSLGKLEECESLNEKCLAFARAHLGNENPLTLRSMSSLSVSYKNSRKMDRAETLAKESLQGFRKIAGNTNPETLMSLYNLAAFYFDSGKINEATPLLEEAYKSFTQVNGSNYPLTLQSANSLAMCYFSQKRMEEASRLFHEVLVVRRRILGDLHTQTLQTVVQHGSLNLTVHKFKEAEALFREALDGYHKVLGKEHRSTIEAARGLGLALYEQKRFEEAKPFFLEALNSSISVNGKDNIMTIGLNNSVGLILYNQGKNNEAERYYRDGYESARRSLGMSNPTTQSFVQSLTILAQERGQYFVPY